MKNMKFKKKKIGKRTSNFGEKLRRNFVKILENFGEMVK